jgi:hypothetical protein
MVLHTDREGNDAMIATGRGTRGPDSGITPPVACFRQPGADYMVDRLGGAELQVVGETAGPMAAIARSASKFSYKPTFSRGYTAVPHSSRTRTTPGAPAIAAASRMQTIHASSGTPSQGLTRPCAEARSNPKRG